MGRVTGFEFHLTPLTVNKIKHLAMQTSEIAAECPQIRNQRNFCILGWGNDTPALFVRAPRQVESFCTNHAHTPPPANDSQIAM
jgi:hypothetical protein